MDHAQDLSTNTQTHFYYLHSDSGVHVTRFQSFESANEIAMKTVTWESGNIVICKQNTPLLGTEPLRTDSKKVRIWTTRGDVRDFDINGDIFDIHCAPDDVRKRLGTDKWDLPTSCVDNAKENRIRKGYPRTDVSVMTDNRL